MVWVYYYASFMFGSCMWIFFFFFSFSRLIVAFSIIDGERFLTFCYLVEDWNSLIVGISSCLYVNCYRILSMPSLCCISKAYFLASTCLLFNCWFIPPIGSLVQSMHAYVSTKVLRVKYFLSHAIKHLNSRCRCLFLFCLLFSMHTP